MINMNDVPEPIGLSELPDDCYMVDMFRRGTMSAYQLRKLMNDNQTPNTTWLIFHFGSGGNEELLGRQVDIRK